MIKNKNYILKWQRTKKKNPVCEYKFGCNFWIIFVFFSLNFTLYDVTIKNIDLTTDDLQASEVSSSKPNILPPDLNSLLLDALNCFLFTLNADGYVEYISENVNQYLKFTQVCLFAKLLIQFNIIYYSMTLVCR